MGTIDIDYTSLGVGLLLLLIPVYFLWRFKTGLLKPILIGAVRMIIQLFFIGVYLRFLFEWNNPFINFLCCYPYSFEASYFNDSRFRGFSGDSGVGRTLFPRLRA